MLRFPKRLGQEVRSIGRRIPGVFWLAGFVRYLRFKRALADQEREYDSTSADVPPPRLRYRVSGTLDRDLYVAIGEASASAITSSVDRHGRSSRNLRVLDFGCGPGRVAVHFKKQNPDCLLFGTDIDLEAVDWARRNLPHVAAFSVNQEAPPLSFPDQAFDLAYTVSVFTHLDERAQLDWLQELARVIRPAGMLVATVHGSAAQVSCSRRELRDLQAYGFSFRIGHTGRFKLDGLPSSYQTTFHTRDYVARTWTRWFDLIEHVEGGLHSHQDLIVLRAKQTPVSDPSSSCRS